MGDSVRAKLARRFEGIGWTGKLLKNHAKVLLAFRLRETVDELNKAMENFVQFTQHCAANGAARREHPDTDQDSGTADQEEGQVTTDEHEQ